MFIKETINAVLKYIETNIEQKNIDIDMLVAYSGYSRRYLQIIFFQHMGITIGKYIQLRRITLACVYLNLTKLPIIEISSRLNYDSQQTFNREFKKNTGYTPWQYRKNKVWGFKNQTGFRCVDFIPLRPELFFLPTKNISGNSFFYRQKIPGVSIVSQERWRKINEIINGVDSEIILSNMVNFSENINEVIVSTVVWGEFDDNSNMQATIGGMFARFYFEGNIQEYARFMHNIYMNTLSSYGLEKRDDYDIEIITQKDKTTFSIEYHLPVTTMPFQFL